MGELSAIRSKLSQVLITSTVPFASTDTAVALPNISTGIESFTAWTQFISSGKLTSHALSLLEIVPTSTSAGLVSNSNAVFQLGSGAAGSEVVRYSVNIRFQLQYSGVIVVPVIPFVSIPANERIAVRHSAAGSTSATNVTLYPNFVSRPF